MKSLKITYTLMLLLLLVWGVNAQTGGQEKSDEPETQKVALGAVMHYSASVIDPIEGALYEHHWELWNSAGAVINNSAQTGVGLDNIDFTYDKALLGLEVGKIYRLVTYVKRERKCPSDIQELLIEIIEKPIIDFISEDVNGNCSFSQENGPTENVVFDVSVVGYIGNWKLHYDVISPNGDKVLADGITEMLNGRDGVITIPLDDRFVNTEREEKFFTVRLTEVEFLNEDGTNSNTVDVPDLGAMKLERKIGIWPEVRIGEIESKPVKKNSQND